jgi:putative endonuclease
MNLSIANSSSQLYTYLMSFTYIYVLQSLHCDFIYVGITHDLKRRFHEHQAGHNTSTKPYLPYKLIHYEAYLNEKDAKRREHYFKTTKGKVTLKQMLRDYLSSSS